MHVRLDADRVLGSMLHLG